MKNKIIIITGDPNSVPELIFKTYKRLSKTEKYLLSRKFKTICCSI